MTVPISPVNNFETSINIPGPGEGVTSAAIALGVQANADRSENNNSRLNDIQMVNTQTGTGGYIPHFGGALDIPSLVWSGGLYGQLRQRDALATIYYDITPYLPPPGGVINSYTLYVNGHDGGSAHGGFTLTLPQAFITKKLITADSPGTIFGSGVTDPSVDLAAYEIPHNFGETGLAETIVADTVYTLSVIGEFGADFEALAFAIYGVRVGWTYP